MARAAAATERPAAARSPLADLPGLGPKRIRALEEAGLSSLEALGTHLPRRYLDRTRLQTLAEAIDGEEILAEVRVLQVRLATSRRMRLVVEAADATGRIELIWFAGARWIQQKIAAGQRLLISGRIGWFRGPQIVHPEFEILAPDQEARGSVVPVYPLTEKLRLSGLDHRPLQKAILAALDRWRAPEVLPAALRSPDARPRHEQLRLVHAPEAMGPSLRYLMNEQALRWFPTMYRLRKRRADLAGRAKAYAAAPDFESRVVAHLPFALYPAQEEALRRLVAGIATDTQTHALLQGDVGSGKTVVCLLASLGVLAAQAQVAVLCPTEVLAHQHLRTFRRFLAPLDIPVVYIGGEQRRDERQAALMQLVHGRGAVAVGTHALLSDDIAFRELGLVVIDEQHRFGVGQRQKLIAKGRFPHVVVASATPIPRSLQLAAYGDMDVVEIRGRPLDRLPVRTKVVPPPKRADMLRWLDEQIAGGGKLYWVVPRIDDGEGDVASIMSAASQAEEAFPRHAVGLLHGRMSGEEQRAAIESFRGGDVPVLVSTTVVEVGVDVPDANFMVIEHPERFGLAQLHQLRGRVGRGGGQGWCFLLPENEEKIERLQGFATTQDGFDIAELDLEERGAGDLEGADQSGGPLGRSGLLREHLGLLLEWRDACDRILSGTLPVSDEERAQLSGYLRDESLGEALTG